MSIQKLVLSAAFVTIAAVASAESYFEVGETLDRSSTVDLGLVRADADGVVEIYDFTHGEMGKLLGVKNVHAGANDDVRVNLGIPPFHDVIAVLRIDGEIVAAHEYDIDR